MIDYYDSVVRLNAHPDFVDITPAIIAAVFDTTVASHPAGVTINTNKVTDLTLTDLVTDATGLLVSSVTGGFTADMLNMPLEITAGTGFIASFYTITEVTDTNNVVVERDMGQSKTGGSGHVLATYPASGNFYITAAATGVSELVPYSSFQDDGAGNVQFTVTAPVQTFAASDTIQFHELCFNNPFDTSVWSTETDWMFNSQEYGLAVNPTINFTGLTMRFENDSSLRGRYRDGVGNSPNQKSPIIRAGTIDTDEYDILENHQTIIFSPTSDGSSGFIWDNGCFTAVYFYNTVIKSSTDYTWKWSHSTIKSDYITMWYCTLIGLNWIFDQGNYNLKRLNLINSKGFLSLNTFTRNPVLSDIFIDDQISGTPLTGSFGTNATVIFSNVNFPIIEGLTKRIAMGFISTGENFTLKARNCIPNFADDEFDLNSFTDGKLCYFIQEFIRFIQVTDVDGNGIEDVSIKWRSPTQNNTYLTNSEGYAGSGNSIGMSYKHWKMEGNGSGQTPTYTITDANPHTFTCSKSGYKTKVAEYIIDDRDEQLIKITMEKRRYPNR